MFAVLVGPSCIFSADWQPSHLGKATQCLIPGEKLDSVEQSQKQREHHQGQDTGLKGVRPWI